MKTHHRFLTTLLIAGAAFSLSGCVHTYNAEDTPRHSVTPLATFPTPANDAPIEVASATPTISESSTPKHTANANTNPPLSQAFSGYGGAMPTGATHADIPGSYQTGEYVAKTAAGDILFMVAEDEARIYSENWVRTKPYGTLPGSNHIANGIIINGSVPEAVASFDEWPLGMPSEDGGEYRDAQIVGENQAIFVGDYVCGVKNKAVTCWNVSTGHGALVTQNGFTGF